MKVMVFANLLVGDSGVLSMSPQTLDAWQRDKVAVLDGERYLTIDSIVWLVFRSCSMSFRCSSSHPFALSISGAKQKANSESMRPEMRPYAASADFDDMRHLSSLSSIESLPYRVLSQLAMLNAMVLSRPTIWSFFAANTN